KNLLSRERMWIRRRKIAERQRNTVVLCWFPAVFRPERHQAKSDSEVLRNTLKKKAQEPNE
ncbi:MAG TPA: hypothetical protein DCO86_00570, partial [Spirochaetaceae bacterium]|nr:hypothetical protein [Spirochaetaceae bacterium]